MSTPNYLLKISLQYTKPKIWRRVMVPADFTLDKLSNVIQIAFGWEGFHLHGFSCGGRQFMPSEACDNIFGQGDLPEEKYAVADVLLEKGDDILYTYDYGDNWEHYVELEDADYALPEGVTACAYCLDGKMAAPPEDCGGMSGFEDFCDAMADPNHPEHEDLKDWYGDKDFDPVAWDKDNVNRQLAKYFKPKKNAAERAAARKAAAKKDAKKSSKKTTKKSPKKKTDK